MNSTSGITVHISETGAGWEQLKGYAGGIALGITYGTEQRLGDDDGIARFIKGTGGGSESSITFREISGDAGQALIKQLAGGGSDGHGFLRVDFPQGGSVTAAGVFHGVTRLPYDPDAYQGYAVSFTQNEPET